MREQLWPLHNRGRRLVSLVLVGAVLVLLLAGPQLVFTTEYRLGIARLALYMAAMTVTWSLLAGAAGQYSFAHVAIAGLAAYGSVIWQRDGARLSPHLAGLAESIVFGMLLALVIGAVLGLLLLRLRGAYLALFTIAFSEIARLVIVAESQFTGGRLSLAVPMLPGNGVVHYYVVLSAAVIVVAAVYGMLASPLGLYLRALREDDEAAASLGLNVKALKVFIFTATSLLVGFVATLYFHTVPRLVPEYLDLFMMSLIIAYAVIGGLESPLAGGVAALVMTFVLESLRRVQIGPLVIEPGVWRFALFGAILVLTLRCARNGLLFPVLEWLASRYELQRATVAPREAAKRDTADVVDDTAPAAAESPLHLPQSHKSRPERTIIDLRVQNLQMNFGGNRVLTGVSFAIDRPQIVGLIGPNGAGKTTLVNILSGLYEPTGGVVCLGGERVDGLPPHEVARRGLGRTFQVPRAFKRMTVLENLLVPALAMRTGESQQVLRQRAMEALHFLTIDHLAHEYARALSGGQLKLLELARLLMLDPVILILDEPFAGVHPRLKETIWRFIEGLREDGRAFLIIEHDMDTIFTLSERLLVLSGGVLIADGDPQMVRKDPAVIEAYLGTDDEPPAEVATGPCVRLKPSGLGDTHHA